MCGSGKFKCNLWSSCCGGPLGARNVSAGVIHTPYKESLSLQPLHRGAHRFSQAKFQALSAWEPQEGAAKVRHLKLAISNRGSEDN